MCYQAQGKSDPVELLVAAEMCMSKNSWAINTVDKTHLTNAMVKYKISQVCESIVEFRQGLGFSQKLLILD